MPTPSFLRFIRKAALLTSLQLSPALALAALATHDLAGTLRSAPTTMGALEITPAVADAGVLAPAGLALTVQRLGG